MPAARKATCATAGRDGRCRKPGPPSLAIPAMTISYTSLITDAEAELDVVLVSALIAVAASGSAFHLNNCH